MELTLRDSMDTNVYERVRWVKDSCCDAAYLRLDAVVDDIPPLHRGNRFSEKRVMPRDRESAGVDGTMGPAGHEQIQIVAMAQYRLVVREIAESNASQHDSALLLTQGIPAGLGDRVDPHLLMGPGCPQDGADTRLQCRARKPGGT
jgi:hypothetical protein